MKKILLTFLLLITMGSLVACNPSDSPVVNPGDDPVEPVDPPQENSKLDDNGTDDVDQDSRIDASLDPNYTDGLSYEYTGDWGYNKDYSKPGLYNTDGTVHEFPAENQATGNRISVIMFGAKPNDPTFDNTDAVEDAIATAQEGDYIYFPAGRYYFSSNSLSAPYYAHIYLYNSKVNFVGAGSDKTVLVSSYSADENTNKSTATLAVMNASDITISGISFTAEVPEDKMPTNLDTNLSNPEGNAYAPQSQIVVVATDPLEPTSNIVIRDCKVSYFQVNGILLNKTQDCRVLNCEVSDATDIGGGGAGYGILLRGQGFESFSMIGTNMDSRYNLIANNTLTGPYMRHAIILSYVSHNNVIYNNTIDGCQDEPLDLHGEDEFLNVFAKNTVKNVTKTAIGLGNPGSTHDATGPGNVVYGNLIENANGGIQVSYGTPDTQIYNNVIKNLVEGSTAINISFGPNTVIRNNEINGISGDSIGIAVYYSYVWNDPASGICKVDVQSNSITDVKTAMYFETYQDGTKIKNNSFKNCQNGILSDLDSFELPPESTYFEVVEGTYVYPTQEGNINRGNYDSTINPSGYYYFKGSHVEPLLNRVIFEEYTIDRDLVNSSSRVYLRITTTSKSAKQHFYFWAAENLEWDATEITWGNAPYINNPTNNEELAWDETGEYPIEIYPYASQIYDPNNECVLITDVECVAVNESFLTYYIDITDYIKNVLSSDNFTIIITNESMDAAYSSVRNMIGNSKSVWPCLIFVEE